jgi:peptide deformylase
MLNPVWLSHSPATEIGEEGCLSVPDRRELVERYQEVTVQFWDLQGQWHIQTLTGFPARIFQHEYDHLQGTLFLDRVRQMAVT